MILFTLPNGCSILHTGDFRAYPSLPLHPCIRAARIDTVYLDTVRAGAMVKEGNPYPTKKKRRSNHREEVEPCL